MHREVNLERRCRQYFDAKAMTFDISTTGSARRRHKKPEDRWPLLI
jgi:hypothetical protein